MQNEALVLFMMKSATLGFRMFTQRESYALVKLSSMACATASRPYLPFGRRKKTIKYIYSKKSFNICTE